jgi:hypothetical protein
MNRFSEFGQLKRTVGIFIIFKILSRRIEYFLNIKYHFCQILKAYLSNKINDILFILYFTK